MPKFIIEWNSGYGMQTVIVEAADLAQAERMARDAWREEVEAQADWSAEEYSKELAQELGLEEPDDGEVDDEEETE